MKQKIATCIYSALVYCISATLVFAQSAALLPNAQQVYLDNNGNPLSGGSVTFYYPSTTNLKPIWQDAGEATPYANPITLNSAGRPPGSQGIYGQGAYRQIVKDINNNTIWDAVTSSAGSSSGVAATGDGDLVGTIKPWAGIQAPNQYQFAYGQQLSRTTFAPLFTAITLSTAVTCTSSSNTLSGISDTTQIPIGAPIEVTCVAPGTTVSSKTANAVVMSNPSSVSLNTTAVFFPFGNGDGSTTFTLPDFRGNVIAGRPNMGGTASTNLTNCTNAAQGTTCGNQNETLARANLPNITYTPIFTGTLATWSTNTSNVAFGVINNGGGGGSNGTVAGQTNPTVSVTPAGTINTFPLNNNVTQTAFSLIQPTVTLNYIIKVTVDTNSAVATGVTDINGMVGSISCGDGLTCTGNIINVASGGIGTPGGANTNIQFNNGGIFGGSPNLTWVSPILTIGAVGTTGRLSIVGSSSGSVQQSVQATAGSAVITWGNTSGTPAVTATSPLNITTANGNIACSTCAITSNPLSQFAATTSAQLASIISDETGTGLAVFNSSPTLVTPILGVASATSINGLILTSSTGTFTLTNGKTLTANNSLTLAGTDATTITFQATDTYVGRATTDTLTNKTLDTASTGNTFKINGTTINAIGGNTAKVGTVAGALTSGHCVIIDANANFIDAGGACTTGGGGGTVNAGTSGQIAYYGSSSTIVSGNANLTISSGALTIGVPTSVQGSILISGATSGTTILAVAAAASGTLTLPSATDTLVGKATTDTLTNKTLTLPIISSISNAGTVTIPSGTDTLVSKTSTDTLTNKTFDTAGTGNSFKIAGTSITSISGNTAKVATTSGTLTNNDCASFDANSNIIDTGGVCGTGTVTSVANDGSIKSSVASNGSIITTGTLSLWGDPGSITNCILAASVSGNALTVTLQTQNGGTPSSSTPCLVSFRNATAATGDYTYVKVTAATTFATGASGSTFGSANATPFKLWITALNNAGTVVLGVSIQSTTTGTIYPLNEGSVQNSTACNACTNASSSGVFYTTATQTSKAIRILGYMEWGSGLTTAGTWASGPTTIQMFGPGIKKPGDVVQSIITSTTTQTTTTSTSYVSTNATISISPTSSTNLVKVRYEGGISSTVGGTQTYTQLFRNPSGSNTAIGGVCWMFTNNGGDTGLWVGNQVLDLPGTTSSTTYTVKLKNSGGGTAKWADTDAVPGNSAYMYADEIMG